MTNYTRPFRIVESSYNSHKATITPQGSDSFLVKWDNNLECTFDKARVDECFEKGIWKELEEPLVMPLGESFRFEVNGYKYVFTSVNEKVYFDKGGFVCDCTPEKAEELLLSGYWKLLPSTTNTPSEPSTLSDEESFTLVEKSVNAALFPVKEAVAEGLLEVIKQFTASGNYDVCVSKEQYVVYWDNTEFYAKTDEQLVRVMDAVKTLEGAV